MARRDIITIGASAGGVEGLLTIAEALPEDLQAAAVQVVGRLDRPQVEPPIPLPRSCVSTVPRRKSQLYGRETTQRTRAGRVLAWRRGEARR